MPQNQFFWHSRNAAEILAWTMYLIEGQFNVWWRNVGRQQLWQMPHKGHSGRHHSDHSNLTSQGHFQSFEWYLYKMFLVLVLLFDQFASAISEFCKERSSWKILKNDFLETPVFVRDSMLIFWGIPDGIPVNSEYSQELCKRMNNVGLCRRLPHFLYSKIWPPNIALSFHQVHCIVCTPPPPLLALDGGLEFGSFEF